jgi:hypothetical protein
VWSIAKLKCWCNIYRLLIQMGSPWVVSNVKLSKDLSASFIVYPWSREATAWLTVLVLAHWTACFCNCTLSCLSYIPSCISCLCLGFQSLINSSQNNGCFVHLAVINWIPEVWSVKLWQFYLLKLLFHSVKLYDPIQCLVFAKLDANALPLASGIFCEFWMFLLPSMNAG